MCMGLYCTNVNRGKKNYLIVLYRIHCRGMAGMYAHISQEMHIVYTVVANYHCRDKYNVHRYCSVAAIQTSPRAEREKRKAEGAMGLTEAALPFALRSCHLVVSKRLLNSFYQLLLKNL